MAITSEKKQNRKIIDIVRKTIEEDKARREKFKMGEQYSFIPEKLQAILKRLEDNLDYSEEIVSTLPAWYHEIAEDEQEVFIYLYNAQGKDKHVWERLLSNNSFAEQCFSRPVYLNQADVEKILHSRGDIPHHAFITVIVKKHHILPSKQQDSLGGQLVRLVENSLKIDNIVEFFHLGKTYYRDHRGRLLPKE